MVFIMNTIVPFILEMISPGYYFKWLRRYVEIKKGDKSVKT
jgi:hypothetical protein